MTDGNSPSIRMTLYAVVGFIIFDVISLVAYTIPLVNWILLPLAIVAILYAIARDERWMMLLPLAELMWGSFGASLQWQIGGFRLSIRILLFMLCIGFWAWKRLQGRYTPTRPFERDALQYVFLLLPAFWATGLGLLRGSSLGAIFFDGNAYLYFLYIPLWHLVYSEHIVPALRSLIMAVALSLSLKTLILMNIFTNQYDFLNVRYVYLWIRDTRIGEITETGTALFRIFIQSQLYIGIGIMMFVADILYRKKMALRHAAYGTMLFAGIIASMSRSYWIGLFGAMVIVIVFAALARIVTMVQAIAITLRMFVVIGASLLVIALFAFIPGGGRDLGSAFGDRFTATDAAGSSRAQLIGPLLQAIRESPYIGQGFGTTVTYNSNDPRIKNAMNPEGVVTTYAFEWGYLDQWLKWGALGMLLWGMVIIRQYWRGVRIIRTSGPHASWVFGLLAGLFFVVVVHSASPYLNHPLGIGYLLLTMLVLQHSVQVKYA